MAVFFCLKPRVHEVMFCPGSVLWVITTSLRKSASMSPIATETPRKSSLVDGVVFSSGKGEAMDETAGKIYYVFKGLHTALLYRANIDWLIVQSAAMK